jgi:hypothetical protein
MSEDLTSNHYLKALKTMALLSFICSAFWLIACTLSLFIFSNVDEKMIALMNNQHKGYGDMMQSILPVAKPILYSTIGLNIVSLVGVMLMRQLRFYGLYIYMIGELGTLAIGYIFNTENVQLNSEQIRASVFQMLFMISLDSLFIFQYHRILKLLLHKD